MVGVILVYIDFFLKEKLCVNIKDKMIFLKFKVKVY